MEMPGMLRVWTLLVIAYYSNLSSNPSYAAGNVSWKEVFFKVTVTADTVIMSMAFILASCDSSTSTFPANGVHPDCGVLFPVPSNPANYIEDASVVNIVRASSVNDFRALRAFRVSRCIKWTRMEREWPFSIFSFESGVVYNHRLRTVRR